MQMFFNAFVLCILRLFKLKTEGQTIYTENLTPKLQNSNQNSRLSWVRLIELERLGPRAWVLGLAKSIFYLRFNRICMTLLDITCPQKKFFY